MSCLYNGLFKAAGCRGTEGLTVSSSGPCLSGLRAAGRRDVGRRGQGREADGVRGGLTKDHLCVDQSRGGEAACDAGGGGGGGGSHGSATSTRLAEMASLPRYQALLHLKRYSGAADIVDDRTPTTRSEGADWMAQNIYGKEDRRSVASVTGAAKGWSEIGCVLEITSIYSSSACESLVIPL